MLAIALLAGCAYSQHLKRGDEYLQAKQWQAAQSEYEAAISQDPGRPEGPARITALKEAWATEFTLQADHERSGKQYGEAVDDYQRALQIDPGNPSATARLAETLDDWVKASRLLIANRQLTQALSELDALLKRMPSHQGAYSAREEARFMLAAQSFAVAENFEKTGKLGNALIEYLRADQARVGATPARERAEVVRKKLLDSIAWYGVVSPVVDRANAPDVAARFTAGRLGATGQRVPIRFVTAAPPNSLGLKISLTLDRVVFNKEKETTQRVQKYTSGVRSVPNPKRSEAEKSLLSTERKLEEDEDDADRALRTFLDATAELERVRALFDRCKFDAFTRCQKSATDCGLASANNSSGGPPRECKELLCDPAQCAADDAAVTKQKGNAQTARDRLEALAQAEARQKKDVQRWRDVVFREPLTIDEPMQADYYFDVELHRATVRTSVTLQLESLTAEAPPAPITHDYVVVHEDTTHKAFEKYGIIADPLQVKNELELRLAVGDAVLVDVFNRVKARFETYRQALLADARRGLVRAGAEDAIEASVRAVLSSPDAPPKDLLQAIGRARGVNAPEGILAL